MAEHRPDQTEPRPLLGVESHIGTSAASTTVLRVAVTNAAAGPRVLAVSAVGLDPSWVDGTQRTDVLEPGGSAVVEFRITPPLGTLPAQYPLVIAAQPLDPQTGRPTSSVTGTAESTLVVDPRTQLAVDLEPRELRMVGSRRFQVLVTNGGVTPAKVNLLLQSGSQVSFQLGKQVEVAPGTTAKVRGRARVKRPQMLGGRITHAFTITARGTESVKHVDGQVVQKSAVGPSALKALMLLLVLAVWAGAAIVFIPALAREVRSTSEEKAAAAAPGADEGGEEGAADPGAGGDDGGEDGGEDGGGDDPAGGEKKDGLQLSGTVAGDSPGDVTVRMEPTSLVDEEAQGGVGVGVPGDALAGSGKSMASAFLRPVPRRQVQPRSVTTADDGSWAFPSVRTPGYYLVTFEKLGYQTQRFVIDSSSEAAAEPLEVEIAPGEAGMSGRITGPGGQAVGGASITITDGTNTITTTSNSEGERVGAWSIDGLSSPSTYVVMATRHGMSSEARTVDLAAGGTATADLHLVDGVATLSGSVRGPVSDSDDSGLGGITVAVSDAEGKVRTATTLTQSPRGHFSIPSLPSPGSYSVTVSGSGYQAQTTGLDLRDGQARADLDFTLRPSTGRLSGKVLVRRTGASKAVGLENAGMTLSNAESTYKTTSTRSGGVGTYGFTGVTPGTYTLTTRYFGLVTSHTSVKVDAGLDDKPFDVLLDEEAGSGLPATATVAGTVIDALTGQDVDACTELEDGVFEPCLTASVEDAGVVRGGTTTDATPHSTTFAPNEQYELPDPETSVVKGLRPGLHTITLTAPGYEVGTVDVEVGQGGEIEAPLAQLYPAPTVFGTIDHAESTDAPDATSCVWVLKGTVGQVPTSSLGSCHDAMNSTPKKCTPGDASYNGTPTTGVTAWCASTRADGTYSVQVPTSGTYTLWVQPDDAEYVAREPVSLSLDHGAESEQNRTLDRYGQVLITVQAPNASDRLVAVDGVQVTTDSRRAVAHIPLTGDEGNDTGKTRVLGLSNERDYTFEAKLKVDLDPSDPGTTTSTLRGAVTQTVPLNTIRVLTLRLTLDVPGMQGRVTSSLDGSVVDLADVRMLAARSFDSDGNPIYADEIAVHTDVVGCFGVESDETPVRAGGCVGGGLSGTSWPVNTEGNDTLAVRTLATNQANYVTISAEDYETKTWTGRAFATSGVTKFALDPAPVALGSVLARVKPDSGPAGEDPEWDQAVVTVAGKPGIVVGVTPSTTDPTVGVLSWRDPSVAGSNQDLIRPGTYTVTLSGVPGHEPGTGTLVCVTGGACSWASGQELRIERQGSIRLTVEGNDGPIEGADVAKLSSPASSGDTNGDGEVVFVNIAPAVATTLHSFEVRAGGYDWDTTGSDAVEIDCGLPGGAITIKAGETTDCTVTLTHELATLSGILKGVLDEEGGDTDSFEYLGGFEVELQKCLDDACASLDTTFTKMTRTTPLATTNAAGTVVDEGGDFSFGGSVGVSGVPDLEGLFPGSYLLTVPDLPQGFSYPSGRDDGGTVVSVPDTGDQDAGHALLYAQQVDFDVQVVDQHGKAVSEGAVRISRDPAATPTSPGQLVDEEGTTDGVYSFEDVLPGIWYIWVTADGLKETGAAERIVGSSGTGGGQVVPVEVTRAGAQLSGAVTTRESGTSQALGEVDVSLACAPGNTVTPDRFCNGAGPALGTDGEPLTATTSGSPTGGLPAGGYAFDSVPTGTYDVTFSKPGYGRATVEDVQIATDVDLPLDQELNPIMRDVVVVVRPSHASPPTTFTSGTTVTLNPRPGTIAPPQTFGLTQRSDGAWIASFPGVRWGCWDVVVDLPTGHDGTVGPLQDSPTQPGLGCGTGRLTVPDEVVDGDLVVSVDVAEGLFEYDVAATTWINHDPPAVTLLLKNETTGDTTTLSGLTGSAWITPGTYLLTVELPAGEAPYWDVPEPYQVVVPPGTAHEQADETVTITENDFEVIVSIPTLPDGETGYLLVSPGLGQAGTYPNRVTTPSEDVRVPVTVTEGRQVRLELPRGKWLIEGSWTTGPDADVVDVAGAASYTVQLGPGA